MEAEGNPGVQGRSLPLRRAFRCTQAPSLRSYWERTAGEMVDVWRWLGADAFGYIFGEFLRQVSAAGIWESDSGIIPVMEGRRDSQEKVGWDVAAAEPSAHPQEVGDLQSYPGIGMNW